MVRVEDGPDLLTGDVAAFVVAGFGPFNPRGGFALDAKGLTGHGLERDKAAHGVLFLNILEYALLAPAAFAAAL